MNTATKTRGRPKGAVSLVNITLKQLNEIFHENTAIPVGAIFMREYGICVQAPSPIIVTAAPQEEDEPEAQIQFSVTRYEKEELPTPPEEILVEM